VSEQVDRAMAFRGASGRSLGCSRRSLLRCLKSENISLNVLADVFDALGFNVLLDIRPRGGGSYVAPLLPRMAPALAARVVPRA